MGGPKIEFSTFPRSWVLSTWVTHVIRRVFTVTYVLFRFSTHRVPKNVILNRKISISESLNMIPPRGSTILELSKMLIISFKIVFFKTIITDFTQKPKNNVIHYF